jgi:hypothetical protein
MMIKNKIYRPYSRPYNIDNLDTIRDNKKKEKRREEINVQTIKKIIIITPQLQIIIIIINHAILIKQLVRLFLFSFLPFS